MKLRRLSVLFLSILCLSSCSCKHVWQEATCTTAKVCVECGETEGEAVGHVWANATCTTPKMCTVCELEDGDALGHETSKWKVVRKATCSEEGEKTRTCTRCEEVFVKKIEKLEHQTGKWEIKKAASLDEDGERVKKCTVCNEVAKKETVTLTAEERHKAFKAACKTYTYDEIARYPEKYEGRRAKFKGEVIQVMESSLGTLRCYTLRVDVTKTRWGYDDTVYVTYIDTENSGRILEDDIITMYGTLDGTKTYETIMGSSVTIPKFSAQIIE